MSNIWDDPDLQTSDEYIKIAGEGDTFEGQILVIRKHTFEDGDVAPALLLRCPDGVERTWTAGQVQAKRKLQELRPAVGEYIRVRCTQVEKRGTKTLKHLDITIPSRGQTVATPAPPTPPQAYGPGGPAQPTPQVPAAVAASFPTATPVGGPPVSAPPAAAAAVPPAPAGVDPDVWAAYDGERRAKVLAALGLDTPAY